MLGSFEASVKSEVVPVQCSSNMLDWYLNLVDLHLIFIKIASHLFQFVIIEIQLNKSLKNESRELSKSSSEC